MIAFDLLVAALRIVSHPLALVGFIALGVVATSGFKAARYGALWALAVQLFEMALHRTSLAPLSILFETGLRAAGGVLISVGVFYLARWLRRHPPTSTRR